MLKALELIGFKSFADRTRFEFHSGITVVVGPNGSGKSNVVDAIKWVLGEQSVKSLRGKEMADVIFNGSGSRPAMNAAETTLTFDNSQGLLPIDAAEVHVTRRVYRNGEGEYLINRQPCRLRDIRDLLAGTGVGSEGYSVIEQGKVDSLLQTSARERRVIFEEAAGISRFRAKKVESLRRLDRVEQNLLRLADIVEEVESRLRSVRNQAGKARRYREYADRLQELRTQVSLADWRKLSGQLLEREAAIQSQRDEIAEHSAQLTAAEGEFRLLDAASQAAGESTRGCEQQWARHREQIALQETAIDHERKRCADLQEQIDRHRRQMIELSARMEASGRQQTETQAALEEAAWQQRVVGDQLSDGDRHIAALTDQMRALRQENEDRRTVCLEAMRTNSALGNEINSLEVRLTALAVTRQRAQQDLEEAAQARWSLVAERQSLVREEAGLAALVEQRQTDLLQAQQRLRGERREHAARSQELAAARQRLAALLERIAVLDELEQRLEGHTAGTREVMRRARSADPGPFRQVIGLVAELLRVELEFAPLTEILLGDAAGHVVIGQGPELLEHVRSAEGRLPGRVGFIRLPVRSTDRAEPQVAGAWDGLEGVLGRGDQWVQTDAEHAELKRLLLGETWIVDSLPRAMDLAKQAPGARFATTDGELLTSDGTVVVNARQSGAGLISRRSELRSLRTAEGELRTELSRLVEEVGGLERTIALTEQQVESAAGEHRAATERAAQQRLKINAADERLRQVDARRAALEAELADAEEQHIAAATRLEEARQQSADATARLTLGEIAAAEAARRLEELEQLRQRAIEAATIWQVDRAKSEERLHSLQQRLQQIERDRGDHVRLRAEHHGQLALALERQRCAEAAILDAESEVAELYWRNEALAAEAAAYIEQGEKLRQERAKLESDAQRLREAIGQVQERLHRTELSAGELRLQRSGLAARLRDDYGIELAELEHEPSAEEQRQREEVDREIADLRRKINSMGAVNVDALAELDELEARFSRLSGQYQDLASAKASLQQIIGRINADSRRLFTDTLEAVRIHFQGLFRKLFGGGQADIKLEEGVDPLESGIEIIARPPGKDLPNISLYSGGERTLTSVALLLAIFANRPSPFCVLDEVDANLDEANIERFTSVVKDFLSTTQFIVVTHSKKTMTCASTLYGVTMQESGVSKPVSVRFEDVSDNGEIRWQPAAPSADKPADDETQAA